VIRPFGIGKDFRASLYPVSEHIRECVRASLPGELGNQATPWFTVSPFSKWSYKEWSRDKWVQIFNWLWNEYGVAVLVVGSKDEKIRADDMIRMCSGHVYNLSGKTKLSELIELVRMSHLHISVDTGAAHIAAAVGTPTITIYGPSYSNAWAYPGKQHMVVLPDMECVPCHKTGCNGQYRSICLETLEAEKVQRAIKSMVEEHCHITSRVSS
jgi:ADP-heptose:LPS heptosyltransferase